MQRTVRLIAVCGLGLWAGTNAWAGGVRGSDAVGDMSYEEAPELAAQVAAGELPPVEERLPRDPEVVIPLDELGHYGGNLRRSWGGRGDAANVERVVSQGLIRFTPDVSEIRPNLASSVDVTEGQSMTFTLVLREGIKWSDGDEFSVDDVIWWYENIFMNEEMTPVPSRWLTVAGEPVVVQKVDEYTVNFRFAESYRPFTVLLASGRSGEIIHPSHLLEQFHPAFVDADELKNRISETGFEDWTQLMERYTSRHRVYTRGIPTLNAWVTATDLTAPRLVMERNPYFWKVDSAGRQLPYIDTVTFEPVTDREVVNLMATMGELDFQFRDLSLSGFAALKENEERGGYRTLTYVDDNGQSVISINLTNRDSNLRAVVSDVRFRKAMSYAIDRNFVNDVLYLGLAGPPSQVVPFPESPFHLAELASAYVEYDPDRANALLDEMGLGWDAMGEWRLRPDGERLSLTIEITSEFGAIAELIMQYWNAVGVETSVMVLDRAVWYERYRANEIDVSLGFGASGMMPLFSRRYYVPTGGPVLWGPEWQLWYESGGERGEEPPDFMIQAIALYEEIMVSVDPQKQHALFNEILRLKVEHLWNIGILSSPPSVGVANAELRNVPEKGIYSSVALSPANFVPEQFFYAE